MAGPTTHVVMLLLLALCAHCIAPAGSVVIPSFCCMSFISKKIPENRIVSYQFSRGSVCPRAGVIFTTKKGRKFCGSPQHHWVQRYMRNLDAKWRETSVGTKPTSIQVAAPRHPVHSASIKAPGPLSSGPGHLGSGELLVSQWV
ncbi:PREDICTED: C-C motif chemokine 24 [Condylura cristata]|uniref:C-C motif chemokine 24 n=1 Tax=Condylura cristata TaxID=143302 RepID=UPI0003346462|nr:PREDICTED: C-C motif chemokine 24 [Condylura cristata]